MEQSINPKLTPRSHLMPLFDHYSEYYASGSSHTAKAKRSDIERFVKFLSNYKRKKDAEALAVGDWDFSATQRFVDDLLQKGEAPATVSRRLATLKHIGRTLADRIPGFINPSREVKGPRLAVLTPKSIPQNEVKKIKQRANQRAAEKPTFIRSRNRTLFAFLLDTGLRADEVRLLKYSQVSEKLDWIESVRTKGKRYRNVYITSAVREELKAYLHERELHLKRFVNNLTFAKSRSLPLFISTYKADVKNPETFFMSAKSLWRAIHELSCETKLHPHLLRHSFAHELLDHSNDVRLVAQALGHSDVRVTMRYTERSAQEVAAALEGTRKKKRENRQ
jgi:integrase/recombinase XerC